MELQNGRPDNTEGRLEKELRVYDLLDRLGVAYQRVDHEAAMTMEACEEIDRVLGDGTAICKNLFLCNRVFKTFICEIGIYGEISGHHTGVGQRFGIDE